MNVPAGDGGSPSPPDSPEVLEPAVAVVMPRHAEPTIYDVARVAGVAPSTVSRALSKPDLVEPQLTTIASPLISLGSAAVAHLVKRSGRHQSPADEPVVLPARLVVRGS